METHNPNEIAKKHLDKWNEVTGFVEKETGYYWELLSVMEDAAKEYAEQRSEAGQLDTLVSVDGLKELDWKLIGEGDYAAEHGEYFARIEELDRANIWFQLYKDGNEMFIEDNYVQSLEQAERAIMKVINGRSH